VKTSVLLSHTIRYYCNFDSMPLTLRGDLKWRRISFVISLAPAGCEIFFCTGMEGSHLHSSTIQVGLKSTNDNATLRWRHCISPTTGTIAWGFMCMVALDDVPGYTPRVANLFKIWILGLKPLQRFGHRQTVSRVGMKFFVGIKTPRNKEDDSLATRERLRAETLTNLLVSRGPQI